MDVTITCVCPPKGETARHPSGDTVSLRERLDPHASITIRKAIGLLKSDDPDASAAEILALLSEHYLLFGVESWTLQGADGKAIPVNRPAIRGYLLSRAEDITPLIDAADELYAAQVLLPLLQAASTSLPPTPTPSTDDSSSTSAPTDSPTPLPKRSKRSSTTTIRMDGIDVTSSSLDGVSNSSPSSQSAA